MSIVDDIDLPHYPVGKNWIESTVENSNIKQIIPLYTEVDEGVETVAMSVLTDDRLECMYLTFQGWNRIGQVELANEPIVHYQDPLDPVVGFTGDDSHKVKQIATELGNEVAEFSGMAFVPYFERDKELPFEDLPDDCNCVEKSLKRTQSVSNIENAAQFRCEGCISLQAIEYNGKKRDLETVFDADWILEDSTPDIIEIGSSSDFILGSPGSPVGKLERVIDTLASIGGIKSDSFSQYTPSNHNGLVYFRDYEAIGYVTWENLDEIQVIRQLFVREEYRRKGIATQLIETWCEKFCTGEKYYIDEPNEKSKALHEKIGHRDNGGEYEAIELHVLRGVGNDPEEGMEI